MMNNKEDIVRIQVSGIRYSNNSIGALVDLLFDDFGNNNSSSRLVWFPKSICKDEEEEYSRDWYGKTITSKRWFITAPIWFLEKNNIEFNK